MSPKKLPTRAASRAECINRRRIAEKYLEVAEIATTEDGTAINVSIGLAVLAGIAAADTICGTATGQQYSGHDHAAAAVLKQVDEKLGNELRVLVDLKPGSHYGNSLLIERDRKRALRAARTLVSAARERTI